MSFDNSLLVLTLGVIAGMPPTLMAFLAWRRGLLIQKTSDEIHVSTNATLTTLREELKAANQKIDTLETLIREHITNLKRKK